jgi:hypothetical protein
MKVKELVKILKKQDQDLDVLVPSWREGEWYLLGDKTVEVKGLTGGGSESTYRVPTERDRWDYEDGSHDELYSFVGVTLGYVRNDEKWEQYEL